MARVVVDREFADIRPGWLEAALPLHRSLRIPRRVAAEPDLRRGAG